METRLRNTMMAHIKELGSVANVKAVVLVNPHFRDASQACMFSYTPGFLKLSPEELTEKIVKWIEKEKALGDIDQANNPLRVRKDLKQNRVVYLQAIKRPNKNRERAHVMDRDSIPKEVHYYLGVFTLGTEESKTKIVFEKIDGMLKDIVPILDEM